MIETSDPADRNDLILAMRHSTLAAHPPSLVARAAQVGGLPRLEWQGETHWTGEELLAGPGRKALQEDSALRRAMKFLAEMVIARGPHDMLPLVKLGNDNGHSLGTLKRAKKELGIVSFQDHAAPGRPTGGNLSAGAVGERQRPLARDAQARAFQTARLFAFCVQSEIGLGSG
jgi:hypothetical protein